MEHDKWCPTPMYANDTDRCLCALIRKVREDERRKMKAYLMADDDNVWAQGCREGFEDGYSAALRDAVEVVKGLRDFYNEVADIIDREDALAAIEGLAGKP